MDAYGIALSGLQAAQSQLNAAANNIANANSSGYRAKSVNLVSSPGGDGVTIAGVSSSTAPLQTNPDGTQGSNVDIASEAVNLMKAKYLYDANADVVKVQDQMLGSLLDIFDNDRRHQQASSVNGN